MKRLLLLLFACLALVAAGCGDDDDDDNGGGGGDTGVATDTAPSDTGGGGDAAEVDMKDIEYVPKEITVKSGTTITWTNSDEVPHTVTRDSGPGDFDSGNIAPGETYEQRFDEAGDVGIICTIHPNQTGTVTVE